MFFKHSSHEFLEVVALFDTCVRALRDCIFFFNHFILINLNSSTKLDSVPGELLSMSGATRTCEYTFAPVNFMKSKCRASSSSEK